MTFFKKTSKVKINKQNHKHKTLCPRKIFFNNVGEIKELSDQERLKEFQQTNTIRRKKERKFLRKKENNLHKNMVNISEY